MSPERGQEAMKPKQKLQRAQDALRVTVVGFGPADLIDAPLDPGFNMLEACNGGGKSQVLVALLWALGDKNMRPRLRHGAAEGYVEINDQRIATLDKEMAGVKDNERALYFQSLITEVIVPNVEDPKRAEPRRIAALMELVEVKLTDDALLTLVSDDQEVLDYALDREPLIRLKSVTDAAERIAHWAHYLKREVHGVAADTAQGKMDGAQAEKPEVLSEISSGEAKLKYDAAVRDHDRKSGEWDQRQKRAAERDEIEETLGERPDPDSALIGAQSAQNEYEACITMVADAEARVLQMKENLARADIARRKMQAIFETTRKMAESWDRRKAILDSEITGADADAVETARTAAETAYRELEEAKA